MFKEDVTVQCPLAARVCIDPAKFGRAVSKNRGILKEFVEPATQQMALAFNRLCIEWLHDNTYLHVGTPGALPTTASEVDAAATVLEMLSLPLNTKNNEVIFGMTPVFASALRQIYNNNFNQKCTRTILCNGYLGSISMPMKFLPSSLQATPVVPEPIKGSKTISFFWVVFLIIYLQILISFTDG